MTDVAVVGFAQAPSLRHGESTTSGVEMLVPIFQQVLKSTGLAKDDIGFWCSGSSDYLAGRAFSFVQAVDAIGAFPPVMESHVEMDGAWALYEAWLKILTGEVETALVELYRVTGQRRYLEMAATFVERRGYRTLAEHEFGWGYFQDDVPVKDAEVFHGHAVRALYLAAGAVDVAVETGDDDLLATVIEQWDRTVAARTYLTGGMGSRHSGEAFGEDWGLPPDRAYSETCAAVASVMLSWRLLLATGNPRYADLIERTLYNVVAASPAPDGRAFFYVNTLHRRKRGVVPDPDAVSPRAMSSLRSPWFAVSCCPNNVARMMAGLENSDAAQAHAEELLALAAERHNKPRRKKR